MATLALVSDADFSRDKVDLIKRTLAIGATDDELSLFLYACKRTGLDPFARQIYAVKRSGKMTIQTGIDGYRLIADRTGKLAGISDYVFDSDEGKNPGKATVTVKKLIEGGIIADFTATARWGEYQAGGPMWAKMPFLMLGKCAEALALRKAFPADLSGVYTSEEMSQADNADQASGVYAEVERQKAQHAAAEPSTPPELDWSYQKTTGVLICRPTSAVKRKKKQGDGDYLTIGLNGEIEGKNIATYFHASHCDELMAASGKVCKFIIGVSKGNFLNIDEVLEIDGQKIDGQKMLSEEKDAEAKARIVASILDFSEDDLQELRTKYCGCSWIQCLAKLNAEKERRDGLQEVAEVFAE